MAKKKLDVHDAERWIVLSDTHYPYQNKKFVKAIKRFAIDFDPHVVVMNGDGLDFYDLSRFDKNPRRRFKLEDEIREFQKDFLLYWSEKHPGARLEYNEGNHELRLQKYSWHHAPEVSWVKGMGIQEMLFERDGIRLDWNYNNYDTPLQCGHLLIHHGLFARKWGGSSAKAMLERYGSSVLCGHSHRMGSIFRTDFRGVHGAWEQGCILDKSMQEYDPQPDWQNGFAVVHHWPNFKGYFKVDLIPLIDNGWFMFNERIYQL